MSRRGRERGAVLVEAAITAPLLFFALFGLIELSFMVRDLTALRGTVQEAIRAASISGDDVAADHHILEVVDSASAGLPDGVIQQVVVFRANGPSGVVPPGCLTGGSSAVLACNVYDNSHFAIPQSDFACQAGSSPDRFWCPSDRAVAQTAANGGPPDYIGVYISIERPLFSGFFGSVQQLEATEILRLEPQGA